MTIEYRTVTDRSDENFHHGHRESNDGSGWRRVSYSDWTQLRETPWFVGSPQKRLLACGIETTHERATEFEQMSDTDPMYGLYYVALAAEDGHGEEAMKWVMGALAAELNARKLSFKDIGTLMSAQMLRTFVAYLAEGKIERTFAKQIFAELMGRRDAVIDDVIADPRFKAVDSSALEGIVDQVIAANPEQFEKARENPKLIQFFVGQTMKASQGKASPPAITALITARLQG